MGPAPSNTKRLTFEVRGKVQGVFFRKHTVDKARELGVVGWCANSARGTVQGEAEGPADAIAQLRTWLETEGSPASRVEGVDASTTHVASLSYASFERRPNVP